MRSGAASHRPGAERANVGRSAMRSPPPCSAPQALCASPVPSPTFVRSPPNLPAGAIPPPTRRALDTAAPIPSSNRGVVLLPTSAMGRIIGHATLLPQAGPTAPDDPPKNGGTVGVLDGSSPSRPRFIQPRARKVGGAALRVTVVGAGARGFAGPLGATERESCARATRPGRPCPGRRRGGFDE